ncbi:hypothetical protein [Longispora urticae]
MATVLPLIGVALGSAGTLVGQFLATRETKKQARANAAAALRAERKEAILAFLDIVQRVERVAERRYQNDNRFVEGSPDLTHEMWYRQKCIDIVGSRELRGPAYELADRLMKATYGKMPKGVEVWPYIGEKRDPFLKAARTELGVSNLA